MKPLSNEFEINHSLNWMKPRFKEFWMMCTENDWK